MLTKRAKRYRASSQVGKICPLSALLQARTCGEAHAAIQRRDGWAPVAGTVLRDAPAFISSQIPVEFSSYAVSSRTGLEKQRENLSATSCLRCAPINS